MYDVADLYQKLLTAYEIREQTIDDMARQFHDLMTEIMELKRELRARDEMLARLTNQLSNILGGE